MSQQIHVPVPPQPQPQPIAPPRPQPSFAPAPPGAYGPGPGHPVGYGPGYAPASAAPPRKRRTGLIVGIVAGVLVLAGLGVGALLLFGSKKLDTAEAERQISRLTQDRMGLAATGVSCPSDVGLKTGTTFTCTATIDGQSVRYEVEETDDRGNVHIASDSSVVVVSKVVDAVAQQVTDQTGVDVTAECDTNGRKVVVDGVGRPIGCTVTNADDPTDTLDVTATVDDKGDVHVTD